MELLQRPLKSHSDLASPKQPETHRASMPERLSPGPPLLSLPQEQRVLSSKQVLRGGRRGRTRSPDPPKPRPTPVQHIFQKPSLSQEEEGICCLLIQVDRDRLPYTYLCSFSLLFSHQFSHQCENACTMLRCLAHSCRFRRLTSQALPSNSSWKLRKPKISCSMPTVHT